MAFEYGPFATPRETGIVESAGELCILDLAVNEWMRRGMARPVISVDSSGATVVRLKFDIQVTDPSDS